MFFEEIYRDWLQYLVRCLKQKLLKQDYLHIDETHVQVLKEPERKNTSGLLHAGKLQHPR